MYTEEELKKLKENAQALGLDHVEVGYGLALDGDNFHETKLEIIEDEEVEDDKG